MVLGAVVILIIAILLAFICGAMCDEPASVIYGGMCLIVAVIGGSVLYTAGEKDGSGALVGIISLEVGKTYNVLGTPVAEDGKWLCFLKGDKKPIAVYLAEKPVEGKVRVEKVDKIVLTPATIPDVSATSATQVQQAEK